MNPGRAGERHGRASRWRADGRFALLAGAAVWLLVILMIVPEDFNYQGLAKVAAPAAGAPTSRLLWLLLLSTGLWVLWWRAALASLLIRQLNVFLPAFCLLAVLSLGWSIDPGLTARRLFRMGTMLAVCLAFALVAWHPRRLQSVLRPLLTLLLAASLAFGLAFPALAIHQQSASELAGAWRGLASHKNGFGDLACIGLVLWLHAWLSGAAPRGQALAGCALAVSCLLLSRSSTALAAALFSAVFLLLAMHRSTALRRRLPAMVSAMVAVLLVFVLAVLDLLPGSQWLITPFTMLAGKDATFTGRTAIWAILGEHIDRHPWLGTGYGAYWTPAPVPGTDAYAFVTRMGSFYPGSAHNGYLDVLNDLGWIGLLCLLAYLLIQVRQSLQLLSVDWNQATLYLALLFQQVLANLSETHWFSALSVDFVLMTLVSVALARGLLEVRLLALFGVPAEAAPLLRRASVPRRVATRARFGGEG